MKKSNLLLTGLLAALVGGGSSYLVNKSFQAQELKNQEYESFGDLKPLNTNFNGVNNQVGSIDFSDVASQSIHGVVHISNYQTVGRGKGIDPFLEKFFGGSPQRNHGSLALVGIGSGVIVSHDGYIATNNHVVDGAEKIEVVLNNNKTYSAKLLGVDPTTDLALLKIEEKDLTYIPFGNSDEAKVGEWVMAVGNPFNLNSTVTAGIISAKSRNINLIRSRERLAIESFIQTDAAVNPGNSGGALINTRGELIGINTAIASPTGAYTGYSFAVPSIIVKKVMDDIKEYGTVQRALLGVSIADVDASLASAKRLTVDQGVYISAVTATGAGGEAGLELGDVIIKVDDRSIDNTAQLQEYLGRFRPGDQVKVTYLRGGKEYATTIKLKNKVGTTEVVKSGDRAVVSIFGSDMQSLTTQELRSKGLTSGIRIVKVGGKFANFGIPDGFVIVRVEKRRVQNPEDILALLANYPEGSGVLIEGINPNGAQAYFGIGW